MLFFKKKELKNSKIKTSKNIQSIKVLGSGCKNCHALLQSTEKAVKSIGLNVEVEYITDIQIIMQYGLMSTPALIINEQIISTGKILSAEKIEQLLSEFND